MSKNNPILVTERPIPLLPHLIVNWPSGSIEFEDNTRNISNFISRRCGAYWDHQLRLQDVFMSSVSFQNAIQEAYRSFVIEGKFQYFGIFHLNETTPCQTSVFMTINVLPQSSDNGVLRFKCSLLGFVDQFGISEDCRQFVQNSLLGSLKSELTSREIQVLSRIANGHTVKEIGDELFISAHTVESHKQKLYKKLQVRNTAELGKLAERFGLTTE